MIVGGQHGDLKLRKEFDGIFGAPIDLGMTFLASEGSDLTYGNSFHTCGLAKRLLTSSNGCGLIIVSIRFIDNLFPFYGRVVIVRE